MNSFQALVCTRWGHWSELELKRLEPPVLQPGQARIQVCHAGVGFALSLFVAGKYQRKPPLPFVPGTEVAGYILEVAPDVNDLHVGQRVVAALDWGGFAEQAIASAHTVYPVPDALDLKVAAALPISYATVWAALDWRARLRAGDVLLVHGAAGGIGMAAVQIGRLMGAKVVATASTEAKRQAALGMGAHHALSSAPESLPAAVKALYPEGVDVVLDPVGGELLIASLRCVAPEARLLSIGFASGQIPSVAANILLVKNAALMGFNYGYYIGWGLTDERVRYAGQVKEMVARVLDAVAASAIRPPKMLHFPLSDWLSAIETAMSRREAGKVIIDL